MKLQIMYMDITDLQTKVLQNEELQMQYMSCMSLARAKRISESKLLADKARSLGAGILLALAYEQFQKNKGESAEADSLFAYKEIEGKLPSVDEFGKKSAQMPKELVGEHGKPFFEEGPYFSISHAKNRVLLAMADYCVGIDVEEKRGYKEAVARRSFSIEELLQLETAEDKDALFTEIWTQKEAMAKYTGLGIAQILDKKIPDGVQMHTTWLDERYVYSVCVPSIS